MNKSVFVFPGQGSQKIGMGIDLSKKSQKAAEIFKIADEILGFSISKMIEEGPEDVLRLTKNTQPAVVAASIAILEAFREKGGRCQATAGHSVGEFTALYCAGVLTLQDCLTLTRARGEYMHRAGKENPGTLHAIIGMDAEKVDKICKSISGDGTVVVANINCPGQVVISGDYKSIEKAGILLLEAGARKIVPLSVSAAFHSPLMDKAAVKLALKLDEVKFSDASVPVYSNVTGEPVIKGETLRELMKKQITSQVLWDKSIRSMISDGIDGFIEIGPGKALCGMIKRIDRKSTLFNIHDLGSFEKMANQMEKDLAVS